MPWKVCNQSFCWMYKVGDILLIEDYPLPTREKDKFFIVIGFNKGEFHLLAMTTSQLYFDISLVRYGEIKDRELSGFCFPAGHTIGVNNFSFKKHTFISHRYSIREHNDDFLAHFHVTYQDHLKNKELGDLIYSFYKNEKVKRTYKFELERILNELYQDGKI